VGVAERVRAAQRPHLAAVLVLEAELVELGDPLDPTLDVARCLRASVLVHEVEQVTAVHLGGGVAEDLAHPGIHQRGARAGVDHPDALVGSLDDGAVALLARRQRVLGEATLVDVLGDAEEARRLAGAVEHHLTPRVQPADLPSGQRDSELVVERRAPRDRLAIPRGRFLAIVGVDTARIRYTVYTPTYADLGVTTAVVSAGTSYRAPVTYRITVTNHGPDVAEAPVLERWSDPAIPNVSYRTTVGDCAMIETYLVCRPGPLAPGASAVVELVAQPSIGGTFSDYVAVSNEEARVLDLDPRRW
jgi:hypothetical protein